MNEYEIAATASACIVFLWVCAYVLSWLVQFVWCFVNDGEISDKNWLSSKVNFSRYRYRVYNDHITKKERGNNKTTDSHNRFSKNKEDEGCSIHLNKIDYKCDFQTYGGILTVGLLTALSPFMVIVYPLTLSIIAFASIAFISRFAMRNKKMFDKHVGNKDAHKD